MARPRKQIDKKDFESLLTIQCTLAEITAFFDHKLNGCSEDTIERWCKKTYKKSFAEVSAIKKEIGKISIRRAQFRMMEKFPAALIWASKQYLGQSDRQEVKVQQNDDDSIKEMESYFERRKQETDS
jgi:hypothetical protein